MQTARRWRRTALARSPPAAQRTQAMQARLLSVAAQRPVLGQPRRPARCRAPLRGAAHGSLPLFGRAGPGACAASQPVRARLGRQALQRPAGALPGPALGLEEPALAADLSLRRGRRPGSWMSCLRRPLTPRLCSA